jgi:hypothetical protein
MHLASPSPARWAFAITLICDFSPLFSCCEEWFAYPNLAQVRKAARQLLAIVQLALLCTPSLPCLCNGQQTLDDMRARLHLQGSEQQAAQYMRAAIQAATNSFYTRQYDTFQKLTNNIL